MEIIIPYPYQENENDSELNFHLWDEEFLKKESFLCLYHSKLIFYTWDEKLLNVICHTSSVYWIDGINFTTTSMQYNSELPTVGLDPLYNGKLVVMHNNYLAMRT